MSFLVFTDTIAAILPAPGWRQMTLPSLRCAGGKSSSFRMIRSPTQTQLLKFCYLDLYWSVVKYSEDHFFQKWFTIICRRCYVFRRFSVKYVSCGISGKAVRESPTRKNPGVSGVRSLGSAERDVRGRKFRVLSIWHKTTYNCWYVKYASPNNRDKFFNDLTALSHNPLKCSDRVCTNDYEN